MSNPLPKFGYIGMTADFLHIGHIKCLKKCSELCGHLTVGIMTDECVKKYKGRKPIMDMNQRAEIVKSIRYVASTRFQDTFEFGHDILRLKKFYEDDYIIFDSDEHRRENADVIITSTKGISSSLYKRIVDANSDPSQCQI